MIVYTCNSCPTLAPQLDARYSFSVWRPGVLRIVPPTCNLKFALFWLAHYLHLFRNRDYAVLFIKVGDRYVHRSCIVPACPRWPFMTRDDVQISSTWTSPNYRGQGFATIGLIEAMRMMQKPGRRFWYISRKENLASIAVCLKASFNCVGSAKRTKRLGLRLLGQVVLNEPNLQ